MTDINKVILIGRVTHDVNDKSFGYIGNGNAKLSISIAVNKSIKKDETWEDVASFFEVVVWGKLAESLKTRIVKGKRIAVSGELRQERWEKDGQKYSRVVVNADSVQLIDYVKDDKKDEGFTPSEETITPSEETISPTIEDTDDIPF